MVSTRNFLSTFLWALICAKLIAAIDGPVFVNPNSPPPQVVATQTQNDNLITQTVYGFLDFTTTIGNTVMVFSPQSAAIKAPQKEVKPDTSNVITTKPAVFLDTTESQIKPSKTEVEHKDKVTSNIPRVEKLESATVSSKDVKSTPLSKVNVIEGISSVVNIASSPVISSKVHVVEAAPSKLPTQNIITKVEIVTQAPSPVFSSKVDIVSSSPDDIEPALIVGNNIGEPEYDFLSRQPSEVVEETYKVINLKPSSKFILKPRPSADGKHNKGASKRSDSVHPTGLVTKLGGTVIKDGTTTVHETSVIGTYISGKYAQVLQSTSHVFNGPQKGGKISPSPTLRILKTAAPSLGKSNKNKVVEPTGSDEALTPEETSHSAQNAIKAGRKPTGPASGTPFKLRYNKNRSKEAALDVEENEANYKKTQRVRPQNPRNAKNTSQRPKGFRNNRKSTTTTPPSVSSEEETTTTSGKRYSRRNKHRLSAPNSSTESKESSAGFSRRYKPKIQTSRVEQGSTSTSLYKFKLNRSPGRWQYKTTPKPRVSIRKNNDDNEIKNETLGVTPQTSDVSPLYNDVVSPQARQDDVDGLEGSESVASIIDDEGSTENKLDTPFPLETIKVEISTPPDFKDIYYEIATIKSPYTFQVGSVKNTRYITVTSTFEKSLIQESTLAPTASEPLTENILATSSNYGKDNNFLDSSVATLPPLYLASDMETPPLETLTETFSTTQTMLKTHILPIIRNPNETETSTLVQTYLITRLVTATKTLPPMEAYHFNPSRTLNEFNSHLDEAGSELHLELDFGDQNEETDGQTRKQFPPDLDLTKIGSEFNLADVDRNNILEAHHRLKKAPAPKQHLIEPPGLSNEQLQQLALLRLLNPAAAQQGQVVTTSRPVIKVETVYESHVIPITNGPNTILSTLSKIVGTVTKTDYEFGTTTIAPALPQLQPALPQLPQLPQIPQVNQLFPQAQPQFQVTTSPVVQSTHVTQTRSKVLKLTFGAKTAYTTIYSSTVVPTVVTTYMTASVAVQPTAAFPGYFPAPYPPYPYVG